MNKNYYIQNHPMDEERLNISKGMVLVNDEFKDLFSHAEECVSSPGHVLVSRTEFNILVNQSYKIK